MTQAGLNTLCQGEEPGGSPGQPAQCPRWLSSQRSAGHGVSRPGTALQLAVIPVLLPDAGSAERRVLQPQLGLGWSSWGSSMPNAASPSLAPCPRLPAQGPGRAHSVSPQLWVPEGRELGPRLLCSGDQVGAACWRQRLACGLTSLWAPPHPGPREPPPHCPTPPAPTPCMSWTQVPQGVGPSSDAGGHFS